MHKVLITDDHQMVRDGIKQYVNSDPNLEVIAEARNGLEASELNVLHRPDIILLDISMPEKNGLEIAPELLKSAHKPKILMLSMYLDDDYIQKCMETGVHGYIHKGADREEVIQGIHMVMSGESFYSKDVKEIMIQNYIHGLKKKKEKLVQPTVRLTRREKEVIKLIMKGKTSHAIAEELFISNRTVDTHRANLMQKLEVNSSIELINKVNDLNLIDE